jgi:hypothetical protein
MKIKELLQEAVSSILFHATSLYSAIQILKSREFVLSADFAKEAERRIDTPMFYLSTSRSRSGEYRYSRRENTMTNVTVLLVLDGNRLNQRYKGFAVEYWGFVDSKGIPLKDEMEDRIFSPNRTIPIDSHIISIDVYLDPDKYMHVDKIGSKLHELYRESDRNGIEMRVFDNLQDFMLGRRPIPREEVLQLLEPRMMHDDTYVPHATRRPYIGKDLTELVSIGYQILKGHPIRTDDIPYKSLFSLRLAGYQYERDNSIRQIDNDIFNATKLPIMEDLAYLMKQFRVRSAKELYELLLQRIYPEEFV